MVEARVGLTLHFGVGEAAGRLLRLELLAHLLQLVVAAHHLDRVREQLADDEAWG